MQPAANDADDDSLVQGEEAGEEEEASPTSRKAPRRRGQHGFSERWLPPLATRGALRLHYKRGGGSGHVVEGFGRAGES
eukprot:scaffold72272_cov63-Phaeocystis_antarctica.AAC.1